MKKSSKGDRYIYKLKDGYLVQIRGADGRRRTRRVKGRDAARAARKELLADTTGVAGVRTKKADA